MSTTPVPTDAEIQRQLDEEAVAFIRLATGTIVSRLVAREMAMAWRDVIAKMADDARERQSRHLAQVAAYAAEARALETDPTPERGG